MKKDQVKLKIEKIDKSAVMPTKGTEYSAGLDLTAIDYELKDKGANGIVLFKTGLKVEIPEGYFGAIYIRSGLASKGKWQLANSVGVIDSDYRGPLMIMMRYISVDRFLKAGTDYSNEIKALIGTRIAQLVIQPYQDVIIKSGKVNDTERSEGGFGSTGTN
jgi:dUTP pyrophosphatase